MDCKRALTDANGDFDHAVSLIEERGVVKAESKKTRATGAGILETYTHNGRIGVLLELRAETDFVVRSDPFRDLARELVMHIAAMDPIDVSTLLTQPFVKDEATTVENLIKSVVAKVGENIQIARFCRYEL